ncbi:MAG: type I 3-dehydroquinate dehydratase [Lachnospiraceae bacterium]|nr:type I 3-dehydroquinate dehydratase [Lachnospiraceae bacterium]
MTDKILERARICVPIVAATDDEIINQVEAILKKNKEKNIDMAEFRADYYEALNESDRLIAILADIHNRLKHADIELLFTIRSEGEGGEKLSFSSPDINEINLYIVEHKLSDLVDVELFSDEDKADKVIESAKKKGIKIIMSSHDFDKTPSEDEMIYRYKTMQERGADIIKLAVMPQISGDVDKLMNAVSIMYNQYADVPVVGISMGELGRRTRVEGFKYGSYMTFATVGKASAPGQVSVDDI